MDENLKEHTVKSYDKDLKSIAGTIDDLVGLAVHSINIVEELINTPGADFIDRIKKHDYKINSLDHLVEKKVTAMLALRQPMAFDLRYIVSALKVSANLERIGDKAKSVVKKIHYINNLVIDDEIKDSLLKMLTIAKDMIKASVAAFNGSDAKKAEKVLKEDDKIDQIYNDLFVLIDHDKFSRQQVKLMINILFIAKAIERIADHTTNIAEITQYVISGEIADN